MSFRQIHCWIKHCILISIHAWLFFEIFSVFGQKFGNESKIIKKFLLLCCTRWDKSINALHQKRHKSKFNFELFFLIKIFGFSCCSTSEDLSIDVLITNVGLILTKLWWFQLFSTSQNSNFELFWKKIKFLGSHAVVLVKTFPLICQLLINVRLILTKRKVISALQHKSKFEFRT